MSGEPGVIKVSPIVYVMQHPDGGPFSVVSLDAYDKIAKENEYLRKTHNEWLADTSLRTDVLKENIQYFERQLGMVTKERDDYKAGYSLIYQAKESLRNDIEDLEKRTFEIDKVREGQIAELIRKLQFATEVLRFYANTGSYNPNPVVFHASASENTVGRIDDGGEIAREALRKLEK